MTTQEIEQFITAQIPLARSMGFRVRQVDESCARVEAPLEPNKNHLGTTFGGSLNAILLLTCYAWLFNVLKARGFSYHVVLKSSQAFYFKAVDKDFTAICRAPEPSELDRFLKTLEKKQRAQIVLKASVENELGEACRLEGIFVAMP